MCHYTVMVQTQDIWGTFFSQVSAVIIGGIIALGANYFLQKKSFNAQNETNQKNLRIAAYNDLLGDISLYQATHSIEDDMRINMAKAFAYGSSEIKTLIGPHIRGQQIGRDIMTFNASIEQIKNRIIEEIIQL
jgi:hypothetical protein